MIPVNPCFMVYDIVLHWNDLYFCQCDVFRFIWAEICSINILLSIFCYFLFSSRFLFVYEFSFEYVLEKSCLVFAWMDVVMCQWIKFYARKYPEKHICYKKSSL